MKLTPGEKTLASFIRSSSEEILREYDLISSQKFFNEIFGTITGTAAIINRNRQVVYVNDGFLEMIGICDIKPIIGKSLGEIISCIHSGNPGGCGASESCSVCGAVCAMLESQKTGKKCSREALITFRADGMLKSLDLNIISTPINLSGHTFYAIVLQDISNKKRRLALERIFFHDVLNSLTGLNGMLTLLKEGTAHGAEDRLIDLSEKASREIIEEIQLHRHILAAETGDLKINIEEIDSLKLIRDAVSKAGFNETGRDKKILISEKSCSTNLQTDRLILQRVLINLLKNALEASLEGGFVKAGAVESGSMVKFWIKNDQVMTEKVKMQLFQRSFSTKGKGRGLGTYSIKLLTENYLKGKVSYTSRQGEGTVFTVDIHRNFPG